MEVNFSQKQIILVTGKGGVGKSTVAAGIAYKEATKGRKTLLVELGEESFYKPFFDLPHISYEPRQLVPNLFVAIWDVEHCLREYVLHFLKVERVYKIFFENRVMRTFINAAPAVSELAILGKVTSNYRHHGPPLPYDLVVVDAHATGHFLALLRAPKGLSEAVRSGPFGEQSASIMNALLNPEITGYVIVTLPEILPVVETEELWSALKNEFGLEAQVICNRTLSIPVTAEETASLQTSEPVHHFLNYLNYIRNRQSEALARLSKFFSFQKVSQSLDHLKGLALAADISEDLS
jgi:anion-transporting  ArsA/GET3 family ATPase